MADYTVVQPKWCFNIDWCYGKFLSSEFETYRSDPFWYYTLPRMSWSAMLKMFELGLESLTDYDMIMMIKNGVRGGVSQYCHRFSEANNKYVWT